MRIWKLEIKWTGYNKRYAKKMIKQIYSESLIEYSSSEYHGYIPAKIAAIKWHRNYAQKTTGECSLKKSKDLVEKIISGIVL